MIEILEEIKQENEWRQRDFAKMKFLYQHISQDFQKLFLRMTIPYLYAHWEGFALDALKKVINYFNKLNLQYNDVRINIFVLSLGEKFNYLKSKQSFIQKCEFSESFLTNLQNDLKFDKKNINTKSNLKFDVLVELCEIFGFEQKKFDDFKIDLDKFVNIRNSIAHGENSYVLNIGNFENYVNLVNNLIFQLQTEIEIYIEEKKYLKQNVTENSN